MGLKYLVNPVPSAVTPPTPSTPKMICSFVMIYFRGESSKLDFELLCRCQRSIQSS